MLKNNIFKVLASSKIAIAGLLAGEQQASAEPTGSLQTYPDNTPARVSPGNNYVDTAPVGDTFTWHSLYDNALTITVSGTPGSAYVLMFRVINPLNNQTIIPLTIFAEDFFPIPIFTGEDVTTFRRYQLPLDLSGLEGLDIQLFMIKEGDGKQIIISEVDTICIASNSRVCNGS
ncbi:hypothetical protein [Candidatus Venteria ishoeyi]|uniref:Uncharacterized protein n=1 Tax=Candidatus Venteria ishoeyi TaxID=1899563 RepID=A0A1H6F6F4_9GAMM|nr:hypothetical protein [Candidatus Venteria ishoeyi]SEH04574.1 Uncharacterised protein [Candidatus Venteria ishoeyi]